MLLREALHYISNQLSAVYEEREAKTISEWLLCDILHYESRIGLYENAYVDLSIEIEKKINRKLKRLLNNTPIQHVIHKAWFFDLEFFVNSDVLIPRPETEEMCRTILNENTLLQSSVLDLATGSGCIAVSIKDQKPGWLVTATDISPRTLKVAQCNAKKNLAEVCFIQDNIFHSVFMNKQQKYDIIISNPPYIPVSEKTTMPLNVSRYDPAMALFVPDESPLIFYEKIEEIATVALKETGLLYMEIHEKLACETESLFKDKGWDTAIYQDINQKPRYIKAQRHG